MNTFRGRLLVALVGFLIVGSAFAGGTIFSIEHLRSDLRRYASDMMQIQNYSQLHIRLGELYSEYRRFLEAADRDAAPNLRQLRDGINKLLIALRAEIEREDIARDEVYHPLVDGGDGAADNRRLEAVGVEIQATLAAADAADRLLRAGRTTEGLALLEDTFNSGLMRKLGAMIDEGITLDEVELQKVATHARSRFRSLVYLAIASIVALVAVVVGTIAAVVLPYTRSVALLQGQADNLALGAAVDPAPGAACRDLAAVEAKIIRAAAAQTKLRDERMALQAQLNERTEAMREEQDALRQIDQVRRDFLADVSHELRTPLTVVRGVAEVALRTELSDPKELKTAMSRIVDETGRLSRIVDDLFLIARSHAGALDLRTDIVDLAAVSQAAALEAQALALSVGGRISWHGVSRAVEVEGDEDRLRQLFTILVDNAFKYGGRSPSVEVAHRIAGETVTIDIRDHGPGVPEADLPHVFDRLYRSPASARAGSGGTGLGLALAKSIVEGHGGAISLRNAQGGGALAQVSLPIFDDDALEASA